MTDKNFDINAPYDEDMHGTHVTVIAGAITNNSIGIAGVAGGGYLGNGGIKLLMLKIGYPMFSDYDQAEVHGDVARVANAITIATDQGAKVINMSFGWRDEGTCGNSPNYEQSSVLDVAIQYAVDHDVILITAIGNDGLDLTEDCPSYFYTLPAADPDVISVAGTYSSDQKANISNYATWCDISAPVGSISTVPIYLDTTIPIGYEDLGGTSMSAPFVAGVAALIRSFAPNADRVMVRNILKQTTDNIDTQNPTYIGKLGTGRLNAYKALSLIQNSPNKPTGINLNDSNNHPKITWTNNNEADVKGYNIHIKYEFRNGSNPRFWSYQHEDHVVTSNSYTDYNWFTSGGDKAYYYVQAVDIIDNWSPKSNTVSCSGGLGKEISITFNDNLLPKEYKIETYPNPFNGEATINISLPQKGYLTVNIFNVQGELVIQLADGVFESGIQKFAWRGRNSNGIYQPSGVYMVNVITDNKILNNKIIYLK